MRAIDAAGTVDPTPAKRTWTVDTTAPTVTNTSPADRASNVALSDNVTATFSEEMNASTLTFTLAPVDSSGNVGQPIAAPVTLSTTDGKTATLDPSENLEAGTTYTATITTGAKDKAGNALPTDKVWSFTTASESVPAAPSNRTAARGGSGGNQRIILIWTDNSNNETGFKVERSTDNATWSQVAAPAANVTSYTNGGLSRGTTYYYRVKATSGAGDSAPSNTASAKTK